MNTNIEDITPEMARKYLESNYRNRPMSERAVESYAQEIRLGHWKETHQGIAFDIEGRLLDGQHRLAAIVRTGMTVPVLVSKGLTVEAMDAIDSGRHRNAGQVFGLKHNLKCPAQSAAACSVVALAACSYRGKLCVPQIEAVWAIYGREITEMLDLFGYKLFKIAPVIGTLSFAAKAHPIEARLFAAQLISGENLNAGMPVLALRNILLGTSQAGVAKKDRHFALVECVAMAFIHSLQGTRLLHLKRSSMGIQAIRRAQPQAINSISHALGIGTVMVERRAA